MKQAEMQNWLLRCWTQQLARDYQRINTTFLHNRLRLPVLEVSPHLKAWGQWDGTSRRLTIKLQHITDYPWTSVLETLKHEMAHQIVLEVFDMPDAPPHGEAWRRACQMLGIEPVVRGDASSPHLSAASNVDDKLRKVRKLLALAQNNSNPHEVEAALEQARATMLRHNIDANAAEQTTESDKHYVVQWAGEPLTRIDGHRYRVASLLDQYFFVQCIWVPTYIATRDTAANQLELCGESSNVEIALYVHDTLLRQLHALWRAYQEKTRARGLAARNSFFDGLLTGFETQLAKGQEQAKQQGLVWLRDKRLKEFFKRRHPRVATTRIARRRDSAIRQDGFAAGRKLQINRPIKGRESSRVRGLLT